MGAADGIGTAERDLERGEVHDVRDLVLVEGVAKGIAVGHVARDQRDPLALLFVEDQAKAAVILTEVEADRVFSVFEQRLDRPRADTAERAGDESTATGGHPNTRVWLKPDP